MVNVIERPELEIYKAPNHVIDLYESLVNVERVELNDDAKQLAELYISEDVVGRTSIMLLPRIQINMSLENLVETMPSST